MKAKKNLKRYGENEMPRFSIITPAYIYNEERALQLLRCVESIRKQVYHIDEIEHIIVNDGSIYPIEVPPYAWIKVVNQPNMQRMEAYNAGFRVAQGEIFCLLDSDDEYEPNYLGAVDFMFIDNPRYKMFNFGCKFIHKDGTENLRGAFRPKRKKVGHEIFGGGNIVNGTFVFHNSVYDDLGGFPPPRIENIDCSEINYGGVRNLDTASPYDFSAYAQMEFPEIRQYFMVNHVNEPFKVIKELGNPFGQDFYLFYKYTRKYYSKPFDKYLYTVHLK